jgi:diphthamide biosynthesis protein 3
MSVEKVKEDHHDHHDHDHHHHENAYEVVKLSDMMYDEVEQLYQYQCPCGDLFEILLEDLYDGEDIALCPSCTLKLKVIYTQDELPELMEYSSSDDDYEDEEEEEQEEKEEEEKTTKKNKKKNQRRKKEDVHHVRHRPP